MLLGVVAVCLLGDMDGICVGTGVRVGQSTGAVRGGITVQYNNRVVNCIITV